LPPTLPLPPLPQHNLLVIPQQLQAGEGPSQVPSPCPVIGSAQASQLWGWFRKCHLEVPENSRSYDH